MSNKRKETIADIVAEMMVLAQNIVHSDALSMMRNEEERRSEDNK